MANQSAVFKVFLSSSFLDMHEERDYLQNHAFKSVSAWLRPKGYRLEVMDLRGSTLQAEDEMQRAEVAVLSSCLRRVTECRPRLIGLLGDRYGWKCYESEGENQPFYIRETLESMAAAAGIPVEQTFDKSITQLEIEHGFRIMDREKCFFYLRDGIPYDTLNAAESELYSAGKPEQDDLKRFVANQYDEESRKNHVRTYDVTWDVYAHKITDLEWFNDMVETDLRESIEREMHTAPVPQASFEQIYFENKRNYTWEFPLLARLETFLCEKEGPRVLLVRGAEGAGKSVLVSQIEGIGSREDILAYVLGVHSQIGTAREMLGYFYTELCKRNGTENIFNDSWQFARLKEAFAQQLEIYCSDHDLALVIDGLDKLKEDGFADNLQWLPEQLPENCRVALTAGQGYVHHRGADQVMETELSGLAEQSDIKSMLEIMAARYSKTYDQEILRLAAKKAVDAGGNPLYARILNDYLMTMTAEEYREYSSANAYLMWMYWEIDEMPEETESIYKCVMNRATAAYGDRLTKLAMGLAAFGSRGMTTFDISEILNMMSDGMVPYEQRTLLELRDFLEVHMMPTRDYDCWTPEHESFVRFVSDAYSPEIKEELLSGILNRSIEQEPETGMTDASGDFPLGCYHAGSPAKLAEYVQLIAGLPTNLTEFIQQHIPARTYVQLIAGLPTNLTEFIQQLTPARTKENEDERANIRTMIQHIVNRYPDGCDFICNVVRATDWSVLSNLVNVLIMSPTDPQATKIPVESLIRILETVVEVENSGMKGLMNLLLGKRMRVATIAYNLLAMCYTLIKDEDKAREAMKNYKKFSAVLKIPGSENESTLIELTLRLNEAETQTKAGDLSGAIDTIKAAIAWLDAIGYQPGRNSQLDTQVINAYCGACYKLRKTNSALAKQYLDRAHEMIRTCNDSKVSSSWKAVYYIGAMDYYNAVGDSEQAVSYARQSLEACREQVQRDEKEFGRLHNLSACCNRARAIAGLPEDFYFELTREYMLVSKKIAEGSSGRTQDWMNYATSLSNLGILHKKRGEHESAARMLKEAVDQYQKLQGDTQLSEYLLARYLCNSAYEYASVDGVEEAAALDANERALTLALKLPTFREFTPAIEHIVLAPMIFLRVVAMQYYNKQDFERAEAFFKKSYETLQELFPGLKTWLCAQQAAASARSAGNCVIEQGKQKDTLKEYRRKAQPYFEECIAWMETASALPGFKDEKIDFWRELALTQKNIGADYHTEGAYGQELDYYQKRLAWMKRYLDLGGERNYTQVYNLAVSNIDIGRTLERLEKKEDAEPHFKESNALIEELKSYEEYTGTLDAFIR